MLEGEAIAGAGLVDVASGVAGGGGSCRLAVRNWVEGWRESEVGCDHLIRPGMG